MPSNHSPRKRPVTKAEVDRMPDAQKQYHRTFMADDWDAVWAGKSITYVRPTDQDRPAVPSRRRWLDRVRSWFGRRSA